MARHLSPSAADRWTECPGSHWIEQRLPPLETSQAAREGTIAHTFAAYALESAVTVCWPDAERIGKLQPTPEAAIATPEMLDGAQEYAAAVVAQLSEHGGPSRYGIECRLAGLSADIGAPEGEPAVSGRADFIAICRDGTVLCADYKYGENAVAAAGNRQMLTYAILARDSMAPDSERAVMGIIQPRADGAELLAGSSSWTTVADIARAREATVAAVRRAYWADDTSERKTGPHCQYCPARSVCTAAIAEPLLLALTAAGHAEITKDATNEQIGAWLTALKRVDKAAADLARIAKARIDAGGDIPGWRLSFRRTMQWPQMDLPIMQQAEKIAERLGIAPAELIKETLRTPADLKKTVPAEVLREVCEEKTSAALIARG